jgi:uncharacterized protein (DUF983 family)
VKLIELEPRWLQMDGRKVGMMLRCPHCRTTWLSCMFEPMPVLNGGEDPSQYKLFERELGSAEACDVVPCAKDCKWTRTSDDFATMTINPSLDASASGHWHGRITAGEVA